MDACNNCGRKLCNKLQMYPWLTVLPSDLKGKNLFDLTLARIFFWNTDYQKRVVLLKEF